MIEQHRRTNLEVALALVAMAAVLNGCSYSYPLDASLSDGKLVFSASRRSTGCLAYFEVTSATGETMWIFSGPYQTGSCANVLPLTYGHVPSAATQSTDVKLLRRDVEYYVSAWDGDDYYGSFRIRENGIVESNPEEGRNRRSAATEMEQLVTNGE